MRVAVVGLGGAGAHAARFLAQDGHRVTGYERHALGHDRGSSHGASRIIRYAYEDPSCTRLMASAYPLWEEFEDASGESLFVRCGGLTLGPSSHERVVRVRDAMLAQDVPFEELPAAEAQARWPALRLFDGEVALHQADAGFLRASACVAAAWRLARAAGAELREDAPALCVRWEKGRAVVLTEHGAEGYDACVISAGAWVSRFVPALSRTLTVLKQQVVHLQPEEGREGEFAPDRLPVWIDNGTHDYGFPSDGVSPGVKVAHHLDGPAVDPDVDDRSVDLCREASLLSRVRRRLPGLTSRVLLAQSCLYTMAPDERFVIASVPGSPGLVVASACSGHGFKFTPLTGRFAADLVAGRELPAEARAWGWPAGA
jgi:sarcosine oxidase